MNRGLQVVAVILFLASAYFPGYTLYLVTAAILTFMLGSVSRRLPPPTVPGGLSKPRPVYRRTEAPPRIIPATDSSIPPVTSQSPGLGSIPVSQNTPMPQTSLALFPNPLLAPLFPVQPLPVQATRTNSPEKESKDELLEAGAILTLLKVFFG